MSRITRLHPTLHQKLHHQHQPLLFWVSFNTGWDNRPQELTYFLNSLCLQKLHYITSKNALSTYPRTFQKAQRLSNKQFWQITWPFSHKMSLSFFLQSILKKFPLFFMPSNCCLGLYLIKWARKSFVEDILSFLVLTS